MKRWNDVRVRVDSINDSMHIVSHLNVMSCQFDVFEAALLNGRIIIIYVRRTRHAVLVGKISGIRIHRIGYEHDFALNGCLN